MKTLIETLAFLLLLPVFMVLVFYYIDFGWWVITKTQKIAYKFMHRKKPL